MNLFKLTFTLILQKKLINFNTSAADKAFAYMKNKNEGLAPNI